MVSNRSALSLDDVLSTKEAGLILRVTERHVVQLICDGKLKAKLVKRDYVLLRQHVEEFNASRRKYRPAANHPYRQYKVRFEETSQ